jgi:hypothetical protein
MGATPGNTEITFLADVWGCRCSSAAVGDRMVVALNRPLALTESVQIWEVGGPGVLRLERKSQPFGGWCLVPMLDVEYVRNRTSSLFRASGRALHLSPGGQKSFAWTWTVAAWFRTGLPGLVALCPPFDANSIRYQAANTCTSPACVTREPSP